MLDEIERRVKVTSLDTWFFLNSQGVVPRSKVSKDELWKGGAALAKSHKQVEADRAWLLERLREAERLLLKYKTMCDLNDLPDPAIDAWLASLHGEEAEDDDGRD